MASTDRATSRTGHHPEQEAGILSHGKIRVDLMSVVQNCGG